MTTAQQAANAVKAVKSSVAFQKAEQTVCKRIDEASKEGKTHISVVPSDVINLSQEVRNMFFQMLRDQPNEFLVKHHSDPDPNDPRSSQFWFVSWAHKL